MSKFYRNDGLLSSSFNKSLSFLVLFLSENPSWLDWLKSVLFGFPHRPYSWLIQFNAQDSQYKFPNVWASFLNMQAVISTYLIS